MVHDRQLHPLSIGRLNPLLRLVRLDDHGIEDVGDQGRVKTCEKERDRRSLTLINIMRLSRTLFLIMSLPGNRRLVATRASAHHLLVAT